MKIKRLGVWLVGCLLLLSVSGVWLKPRERVVAALYSVPLRDLQGNLHTLAEWRGQPLLLNFWASWCAPCREEMPVLERFARAQQGKVQVIGLAWDSAEALADYARTTPVTYPLLRFEHADDAASVLAKLGNPARGLPFSLLLDADAQIRWQKLGVLDEVPLQASVRTLEGGAR